MVGNPLAMMGQAVGLETANARAEALEISRSHLLHVERGEIRPSPALMDRMAAKYRKAVSVIERAVDESQIRLAERKISQIRGFD